MKRLLFLFVLLFTTTGYAQSDIPLIAHFNGQLYRLEGDALTLFDECQPDEQLSGSAVGSPDGSAFVMVTLPKIFREAIETVGGFGGPIPLNLWLCDATTNTLTRFSLAEGGDEPFAGEFPTTGDLVSVPAWSPDSALVAWTTFNLQTSGYAIAIYDPATDTTSTTPIDIPEPLGIPSPPSLTWTDSGMFFSVFSLNEDTFAEEETLYLYDVESQSIASEAVLTSAGETDDFVIDRVTLIAEDGTPSLALRFFEAGWLQASISTGEQQPLNGLPELFSLAAPDAATLLLDVDTDFFFNWQHPTDTSLTLPAYPPNRVAVAPDGSTIAYADSTLHLWRDGVVIDVANSDGFADDFAAFIIWGADTYRLAEGAAFAPVAPPRCEDTQDSRLLAGSEARVVAQTIPNNVRAQPTLSGELVGQLAGGSVFTVLDGPVCADGFAWFQIQQGDLLGWTAEGLPELYWLEPLQ